MKRFLCLMVSLMLLAAVASAQAITLPEKFSHQVELGSGVKGSFTLDVSGSASWLNVLLPFNGAELQLRYIAPLNANQDLQLYLEDEDGVQHGKMHLSLAEDYAAFTTELIPDTVLTLPMGEKLAAQLSGKTPNKPAFFPALMEIVSAARMDTTGTLPDFSARYEAALEIWLADYAHEPETIKDKNSDARLVLRHDIPAADLKDEIKILMGQLLKDDAFVAWLHQYMDADQAAVYLNPDLLYYYEALIDAMPLEGEILLTRRLTSMGDVLSTDLTLPLPEETMGYSCLKAYVTPETMRLSLTGTENTVEVEMDTTALNAETTQWSGILRYLPAEGEKYSAFVDVKETRTVEGYDEKGYSHEYITIEGSARPDFTHLGDDEAAKAEYADFAPVSAKTTMHFYSKSQNNNPTTCKWTLEAAFPEGEIASEGTFKTTNQWITTAIGNEGEDFLTLAPERQEELTNTFMDNAAMTVFNLSGVSLPVVSEPPVKEPAEVPAETPAEDAAAMPTDAPVQE
ncbi:MAG: hypothetical protein E7333_00410 [Clostridiales bacterium]|nr:hypothetical protein [Clostridiales bacterium]